MSDQISLRTTNKPYLLETFTQYLFVVFALCQTCTAFPSSPQTEYYPSLSLKYVCILSARVSYLTLSIAPRFIFKRVHLLKVSEWHRRMSNRKRTNQRKREEKTAFDDESRIYARASWKRQSKRRAERIMLVGVALLWAGTVFHRLEFSSQLPRQQDSHPSRAPNTVYRIVSAYVFLSLFGVSKESDSSFSVPPAIVCHSIIASDA